MERLAVRQVEAEFGSGYNLEAVSRADDNQIIHAQRLPINRGGKRLARQRKSEKPAAERMTRGLVPKRIGGLSLLVIDGPEDFHVTMSSC